MYHLLESPVMFILSERRHMSLRKKHLLSRWCDHFVSCFAWNISEEVLLAWSYDQWSTSSAAKGCIFHLQLLRLLLREQTNPFLWYASSKAEWLPCTLIVAFDYIIRFYFVRKSYAMSTS
jgi:hypothetical protein